jgi:stage V sporulation protein D (sporulation-specific penicillin-binding protein)
LESVVSAPKGTGKNAYVAGYRIGGKTGSTEVGLEEDHTLVSFMGFAPADDPQVIVLVAFDQPRVASAHSNYSTTGVYISGGNMPAPKAGKLLAEILDYMGVEKKYTAEEAAAMDVTTPSVTGKTVAEAAETLSGKNLSYRTVGEGDTVTKQIPASGTTIPGGSSVILYLGDAEPAESGTVPNVVGLSYEAAKKKMEEAGFFMRASGVTTYYSNSTTASAQAVSAGQTAALGTVISVTFTNVVEDGAVDVE